MGWLKIHKLESLENETFFLQNKKIHNQCLRWHISRSYSFLADVIFKDTHFVWLEALTMLVENPINIFW